MEQVASNLHHSGFLRGLSFDPEDGSEKVPRIFLHAVSLLSFFGPEDGVTRSSQTLVDFQRAAQRYIPENITVLKRI
jgi:hypothetical protein